MKYLLITLFVLATTTAAAQVFDSKMLPIIVRVNMWMSQIDTFSTGTYKSTTALIKRKGYVVYKSANDSLNDDKIVFYYLDNTLRPIDTLKYEVLFDRPVKRY